VAGLLAAWQIWGLVALVGAYALLDLRWPQAVNRFEEAVISLLLVAITLVAFTQVVARYGFSTGWTGALELTRILFAWLILFGMSYALKINAHLGVDAAIRLLPRPAFRFVAMFGALACLAYAVILLKSDWLQTLGANAKGGAIDYWSLMFRLGLGLDELRYPEWMQAAFGMQDRVQRWIAYLILPIGLGLFAYRALQALIAIWQGKRDLVISSHEAEEMVEENRGVVAD